MRVFLRSFAAVVFSMACCISAQAGPALFAASFIMHAFGNDVTSGAAYPYNANLFTAVPLGRDCRSSSPSYNGVPRPYYCGTSTLHWGHPATGSGTPLTTNTLIALPQSAFAVTATGALPWYYYPYPPPYTYASLANAAGTFFAAGGPAAGRGMFTHTELGEKIGTWVIHEGVKAFGGALGLLGKQGAWEGFFISGKVGWYSGTNSWNMIPALGRSQYATVIGTTGMGKILYQNPYVLTQIFTNNRNGKTTAIEVLGTGTPWTTGAVTLYVTAGVFETILHRSGYDSVTPGGVRNLQLVTPALTHWIGPGFQSHNGHIGILTLRVPEPGRVALLAAGMGALALLRRARRRRGDVV